MKYLSEYDSPLGEIVLASDDNALIGAWFKHQKHFPNDLLSYKNKNTPVIIEAKRWLDIYFKGEVPDFFPIIKFSGSEFQIAVWNILRTIPYGETLTYSDIAEQIAKQRGLQKMSAQAVGGAVGRNPISIIIPCHRVVGKNGKLTGYAGGIDKKEKLLKLEKIFFTTP